MRKHVENNILGVYFFFPTFNLFKVPLHVLEPFLFEGGVVRSIWTLLLASVSGVELSMYSDKVLRDGRNLSGLPLFMLFACGSGGALPADAGTSFEYLGSDFLIIRTFILWKKL